MTNHKCGTCRFYEVGAQKTHGWCRNPAYPQRDDVALLRNDELACRSGWGKDFWVASSAADAAVPPHTSANDETTQPIPVPIGTGIGEPQPLIFATAARIPAATGMPARQSTRQEGAQGATNAVSVPARALTNAPKDGTMGTTKITPPLSNHPELNEMGIPIRPPKRTSVAEAHQRAMERRAQERQAREERDRLAAQEALKQADALREQQLKEAVAEPKPEQRPMIGGSLKDFGTSPFGAGRTTSEGPQRGAPKREPVRTETIEPKRELNRPTISTPIMPRVREEEARQTDALPRDEAEDMIISTTERFKETVKGSLGALNLSDTAPATEPSDFRTLDTTTEEVTTVQPAPVVNTSTTPSTPPVKETQQTPYWDEPRERKRLARFTSTQGQTLPPSRPIEGQSIRTVGRKPLPEPKPVPTRSIKPMGGAAMGPAEIAEEREIAPPLPQVKPPTVEVQQTIAAPPAKPVEPAPRPIDESLLRQLENDWRAHQRQAHGEQRCGTCRFFQAAEVGRGLCNCPFAPVYHQQTETESLPCTTSLGVWWAAPDEGWLERTERRPRRATPLLDALLREREAMEPLRATPPLRRGAR